MRILYTAFDLIPAPKGASTHITQFVGTLTGAGHDVTLITAGDPALPERDQYGGATLLRVPAGDDMNFLRRAERFGDYVAAHIASEPAYDVVHVRSLWGGVPLAQQQPEHGYKLIYEVNGLPSVELKYHYPTLSGSPLLRKLKRRELDVLHAADAIICVSHVTRAYLLSLGVNGERMVVIPNGVDTDHFTPRESYALNDPPLVLYTGTLATWQGLEILVTAFAQVAAERPARLRIVGRSRRRQRKLLTKRARKLGIEEQVSIEDAVPYAEVPGLVAGADLCVAPLSYCDRNVVQGCSPLKVLEYMACGCPVIASNLPVVRELVHEDAHALLFDPSDPSALAEAIKLMLDHHTLRETMALSGLAHVCANLTWQIAGERLLAVYDELMSAV